MLTFLTILMLIILCTLEIDEDLAEYLATRFE